MNFPPCLLCGKCLMWAKDKLVLKVSKQYVWVHQFLGTKHLKDRLITENLTVFSIHHANILIKQHIIGSNILTKKSWWTQLEQKTKGRWSPVRIFFKSVWHSLNKILGIVLPVVYLWFEKPYSAIWNILISFILTVCSLGVPQHYA